MPYGEFRIEIIQGDNYVGQRQSSKTRLKNRMDDENLQLIA